MTVGDGTGSGEDFGALPGLLSAENAEARLGAAITLAAHADALPPDVVTAAAPALVALVARRGDELPQARAQALAALANLCGGTEASRTAPVLAALAGAADRVLPALAADLRAGMLGERTCAWIGCVHNVTSASTGASADATAVATAVAHQRCSQCRTMWYCSPECARQHWRAGHRTLCRVIAARGHVHAASVPHADEGALAYLAAAVLANATRGGALVASAHASSALAHLACLMADVAARAPLPAAARTLPLVLHALANTTQCAACRTALTAPATAPALRCLVERHLAPTTGDALAIPVATLLRNLCLDKSLHVRLVPSMAIEAAKGDSSGSSDSVSLSEQKDTNQDQDKKKNQDKKKQEKKHKQDQHQDQEEQLPWAVDAPVALLGVLRGEAVLSEGEMRGMPAALRAPRRQGAGLGVREAALEALLCLACDRPARADLITRRAYPVLREYDRAESAERPRDLVQQIVDLLARDSRGDDACPVAEPLPIDTSAVRDDHDVSREDLQEKGARTRGEIEKSPLPPAVHIDASPDDPSKDSDDDDEDAGDDSFVEEI